MRPRSKKDHGQSGKKNDHRRTRTCNLLVPSAIEAKRATIAPGSLRKGLTRSVDGKCQSWRIGKLQQTTSVHQFISFRDQPCSTPAMALNWTMLSTDRTPVPLPKELMVMTVESGEVSLIIPDVPPTGTSTSGGSGGGRKLDGTGKLFLTDQRVRSSETRVPSEKNLYGHGHLAYVCLRERRR